MADKNGKNNPNPKKNDEQDLSPEEMEVLDKIMAEIEPGDDKQDEDKQENDNQDEQELTEDQQAALEKIMAEIEPGDDKQDEDKQENDNQDEQELTEDQQAAPENTSEVEESLSGTAEMETEGREIEEDSTGGNGSTETTTGRENYNETVSDESEAGEKSKSEDEDLESELSKLVGQADSMADDEENTAEIPETPEDIPVADVTNDLDNDVTPNTSAGDHNSASLDSTNTEQIAGHEEESKDSTGKDDNLPDKDKEEPFSDDKDKVSFDPVYLNEVTPETGKKSKVKKTFSRRHLSIIFSFLLIVASLSAGLYLWMNRKHQADGKQAPVSQTKQYSASQTESVEVPDRDATIQDSVSEQGDSSIKVSPEGATVKPGAAVHEAGPPEPEKAPTEDTAYRLNEWVENLTILRREIASKKDEIIKLKKYYKNRITEKEKEIAPIIVQKKFRSFSKAIRNTRLELALRAIQRRYAYIAKLDSPLQRLEAADEEILYYQRLAQIYQLMAGVLSALPIEKLDKELETVFSKNNEAIKLLGLNKEDISLPPLETVWKRVYTDISRSRSMIPAVKADPFNRKIWKQICNGDFSRMHQLTILSPEAAKCLLNWQGKDLYLNDLKELSPEVARILSQWPGEWLSLNGISRLTPEAARYLALWPGKRLSLNGLTELPSDVTSELSKWRGEQLEMIGLKNIGRWDNYATKLFLSEKLRRKLESAQ